MRNHIFLLLGILSLAFTSCDTGSSTETNTERFYATPWNIELDRSHPTVGSVLPAQEHYECTATLTKDGTFYIPVDSLRHHRYQHWSYSWSTDHFYMNWSPCIEWYMNEAEDSMYLHYMFDDYDATTGVEFSWDYELYMTK